jgi:hypothetical protein
MKSEPCGTPADIGNAMLNVNISQNAKDRKSEDQTGRLAMRIKSRR